MTLDFGHEISKREGGCKWIVAGWVIEWMNMPAARIVGSKDPLLISNQHIRCGLGALVVVGFNPSTWKQVNPYFDRLFAD